MVKIKAAKRTNFRHILIDDEKRKVEGALRGLDLRVKPKFKEIFVKSLKDKLSGKIVLTIARQDVNVVRAAFKGKINTLRTSGTIKGLTK